MQNIIPVESGVSALKLTTASYWRPSEKNIHRFTNSKPTDEWGVKPNEGFEVKLSDEERLAVGNALKAWAYSAFNVAEGGGPNNLVEYIDLRSAKPEPSGTGTYFAYELPHRGLEARARGTLIAFLDAQLGTSDIGRVQTYLEEPLRLVLQLDSRIGRGGMQQEHVHMRCGDRAESNLIVLAHEEIAAVDSDGTLGNETIDDLAGDLRLRRRR